MYHQGKEHIYYLLSVLTLLLALFGTPASVCGQGSGKYTIRNYTPREYNGQGQVFTVLQDEQNIIYFGNAGGLIEYDGVSFRYIPTKNNTTVRAMVQGYDGKIYVAAIGELGYLEPDSLGHLEYRSLLEFVPEKYRTQISDVWEAHATPEGVYFQTSKYIFRWHNGKMKVWEAQNQYHVLMKVGNRLFVREFGIGLFELNPQKEEWELVSNGAQFANERIYTMLPYGEDDVLVGTRTQGFYIFDDEQTDTTQVFTRLETEVDDLIIKGQLYCGIFDAPENRYIFGTLRNGIVSITPEGKEVFRINKSLGLQDNVVLFLQKGAAGGLWAGLGYGISRIALERPITQWDASLGLEGSVDEMVVHKGDYYAATGRGVYMSHRKGFNEIPGITTQCWDLKSVKTADSVAHLLTATNLGVYLTAPEGGNLIFECDYAREIAQSPHNPNHFWVAHQDGLTLLRYQNGAFSVAREIKTPKTDIQTMHVTPDGNIWFATAVQGVGHVDFEGDDLSPFRFTPYDALGGEEVAEQTYIASDGDAPLILTRHGIFHYDVQKDSLYKDTRFNIPPNHFVSNIKRGQEGSYWLVMNGLASRFWLEKAYPADGGEYRRDSTSFLSFTFNSVTTVYPDPREDVIWAVGSEGAFRYHLSEEQNLLLPQTLIRKVVSSKDDDVIFWGHFYNEKGQIITKQVEALMPELPYEQNALTFFCATPEYGEEDDLDYSFRLDDHDEKWSSWSADPKKEYTNLFEGSYTLNVRSRDRYGNISNVGTYQFRIQPPWYRTYPAYIIYFVLSALLLWVVLRLNTRRLKREKFLLEEVVQERTKEVEAQKQEIVRQNKNLEQGRKEIAAQKDQLEVAYQNVKLLSEVGKEITSIVSIEQLIETTYEKVNQLMDASGFGIGVHNPGTNKIEIRGFIEKGEKLPPDEDDMEDNRLSVWCMKNNKSVFINSSEEIEDYLGEGAYKATGHGESPESIIYMPLRYEGEVRGVVTVQSFKKNAYATYDLNIVENLANYMSISIENALLYENLEEKVRARTSEVMRQNREIAEKGKLLEQKNKDIETQKLLIEKKNQDITASINYAKRIQDAMLPTSGEIQRCLPDSFIFYKPRDIISGDFYWFTQLTHEGSEKVVIAAVDCTGHGVPGAFMSMIGNELLNEIVNLVGELDPGKILTKLHKGVRKDLRQYENENRDGMDVALCVIDKTNKTLDFAGAKNPLVYIQGGEFNRIRGDKFPIGGRQQHKNGRVFQAHRVSFQQPTTFYIYSDGYQDQFGGPENRKFNTGRFRSLLFNIHFLPMEEQRQVLETTLREWQSGKRQIDDILVIGFSL